MKRVRLTRGQYALVDDEDFERVNGHYWQANPSTAHKYERKYYVRGRVGGKAVGLGWFILGQTHRWGLVCDHKNGDTLDNRKANLRICTHADNSHNYSPRHQKSKDSKYKGIYLHDPSKKWITRIRFKNKLSYIGYYKSEIVAAKAYDREAKRLFGKFAKLNFG